MMLHDIKLYRTPLGHHKWFQVNVELINSSGEASVTLT